VSQGDAPDKALNRVGAGTAILFEELDDGRSWKTSARIVFQNAFVMCCGMHWCTIDDAAYMVLALIGLLKRQNIAET